MEHSMLLMSTLDLLGFAENGTKLVKEYTIPFNICGEMKTSTPDVTLLHKNGIILLVGRGAKMGETVEPPVIADAIAAFQNNNACRADLGLPPLDSMNIPCITMVGTRPTFHEVPVTKELCEAVIGGEYPSNTTTVKTCSPPSKNKSIGLEDVAYRRVAFQLFLDFRVHAKNHWMKFLAGIPDSDMPFAGAGTYPIQPGS